MFWKSAQICDRFYSSILRYSSFVYFNPALKQMRLHKSTKDITLYYCFLFAMGSFLLCNLYVSYLYWGLLVLDVPVVKGLLNVFTVLMSFLASGTLICVLPNSQNFVQFYNSLFLFEKYNYRKHGYATYLKPFTITLKTG